MNDLLANPRVESIDVTPTWSALLPAILAAYDQRAVGPKRFAMGELERMAALADKYVEEHTKSLRPQAVNLPLPID